MKIGIQNTPIGFTERWIEYCQKNNIEYKLVNCYSNDIIEQLKDCDALMWQHDLLQKKDNLVAKRLLTAVEHSGKVVFPSILENWHYDDKVAQKYLLESVEAPLVPTYVFYDKAEALSWINKTTFPKVFKLKGGAGSSNVKLVRTKSEAKSLIQKAFGQGFKPISKSYFLKESFLKLKTGKISFYSFLKAIYKFIKPVDKNFIDDLQKGYAYFQDFVPNNDSDYRIVIINQNKAFGLQRFNRENDFRASGSGSFVYLNKDDVENSLLKELFQIAKKLNMDSVAFDIVFDNKKPLVIEISYAFVSKAYNNCPGYWDENLIWVEEKLVNYQHWMVEKVIEKIQNKQK